MPQKPNGLRALVIALAILPGAAFAQERAMEAGPAIARIVEAPPALKALINADRTRLLMLEPAALPARSEADQPEVRLAGVRINPRNMAISHVPTYTALISRPIGRGETRRIVIPWKARVADPVWSPDGERIAFSVVEDAGISIWVAEAWSGESRMLAGPVLNGALGNPCQWLPGSDGLLCRKVVPAKPVRLVSEALEAQRDPEAAVAIAIERHFSSQLAVFPLSGPERLIKGPGVYSRVDLSPDGRYLLVEAIHPPYSPTAGVHQLPTRTELWDLAGAVLKVIGDRGPIERAPKSVDEVSSGSRAFEWRNDAAATLVWIEAQDGGDPTATAPVRDRMLQLDAPFAGAPSTLVDLRGRVQETVWGRNDLAIVTERWSATGQTRIWIVDPGKVGGAPRLLSERASDDRYGDPGRFIVGRGPRGRMVVQTSKDGRFAYLAGVGASLDGDRPFLDKLELASRKSFRMWRSEGAGYEEAVALLDPDGDRVITRRETAREAPNYFVRDLRKTSTGRLTALTEFKDPSPEFSGLTRQLVTARRKDGVPVSATLYLPAGYKATQGRLPFVLWTDPREFRSLKNASQITGSPYRFIRPPDASYLHFLLAGYGVLHAPAIPIVSEAGPLTREQYLAQLVAGATAAVEKVVALGVADRKRIGIGGDTAGGSTAAYLLEHSDLFRAGIAEVAAPSDSGGRTVLVRPADTRGRPLLMLLPWDGGGPTRESMGQRLSEMSSWMDKYVKTPAARP